MAYTPSDSLFLQHRHRAGWDWSIPTNAVPGVEDLPRRAPAPREEEPDDRAPVFTLEGFGTRGHNRPPKPAMLNTVPGPGEGSAEPEPVRPAGSVSGRMTGAGTVPDTGEWDIPPVADDEAHVLRSVLLDRIARRLVELGTECIDRAHRAGSATRDLCRELLARRLPQAEAILAGSRDALSREPQGPDHLPDRFSDRLPESLLTQATLSRTAAQQDRTASDRELPDSAEARLRPQF